MSLSFQQRIAGLVEEEPEEPKPSIAEVLRGDGVQIAKAASSLTRLTVQGHLYSPQELEAAMMNRLRQKAGMTDSYYDQQARICRSWRWGSPIPPGLAVGDLVGYRAELYHIPVGLSEFLAEAEKLANEVNT